MYAGYLMDASNTMSPTEHAALGISVKSTPMVPSRLPTALPHVLSKINAKSNGGAGDKEEEMTIVTLSASSPTPPSAARNAIGWRLTTSAVATLSSHLTLPW